MKKGLAAMDKSARTEIARKGGQAISKNKEHMSRIGKLGGIKSGIVRQLKSKKNNDRTE